MTQNEYSGNNVAEPAGDDNHCEHECVCGFFINYSFGRETCPRNSKDANVQFSHGCSHDTRSRPAPAQQHTRQSEIQMLQNLDAHLYAKQQAHDAEIAAKARKEGYAAGAAAERERAFQLMRNVINTDASGLAGALDKVRTLAKGYSWIPNGEWGSYDYTQRTTGTLQKEVGYLLEELEKITYEGLRDSGERVNAHIISVEESLRSSQQPENRKQEPDPTLGSIP